METVLKKIFESNPGMSTIVLNEKCSDCGCEVIIEITTTSGGFGLQGDNLFKRVHSGYFAMCPDCYKLNTKMND
jgi:hypothetical protein